MEKTTFIIDTNQHIFCNAWICDSYITHSNMEYSSFYYPSIKNGLLRDIVIEGNVDFKNANVINFPNIAPGNITNLNNVTIENSHILDSLLSNVTIEGIRVNSVVDYTHDPLNGRYSKAIIEGNVSAFDLVESFFENGALRIRPVKSGNRSPLFGIAQESGTTGQAINVLNEGISKVNVRGSINLPQLTKVNGQCVYVRDASGKIVTQQVNIPIYKDDLLTIAGTNNDILVGGLTPYYQFNATENDGRTSVYKALRINPLNCNYTIDTTQQNTAQTQRPYKDGRFITVMEVLGQDQVIGHLA